MDHSTQLPVLKGFIARFVRLFTSGTPLFFLALLSLLQLSQAQADPIKYYVERSNLSSSEVTPKHFRRSEISDLFAEYNGRTYLIQSDILEDYHLSVFKVVDLDGDGLNEAIIEMNGGGNCCGPSYAIVSHRGNGFFSVQTHDELRGWPVLSVIYKNSKPLIRVLNSVEGMDTVSIEETEALISFDTGKLILLNKSYNSGLIYAEEELNANEVAAVSDNPIMQIASIIADLDGDGSPDELNCSYWPRWGALQCKVDSSKYGFSLPVEGSCDRIGILENKTNGLNDLVCNRNSVFVFSGSSYEQTE